MTSHEAICIVTELANSEKKAKRFDRASALETAVRVLKMTVENEITQEIEVSICVVCGSAVSKDPKSK